MNFQKSSGRIRLFQILRIFRVETRLAVYRPLDILKQLWVQGASRPAPSDALDPQKIKVEVRRILDCPIVSTQFFFVYVRYF